MSLRSVELFAGAGGLALGTARAGFRHDLVVEWDRDACNTIQENQRLGLWPASEWPLVEPLDVKNVDFSAVKEEPDLLSGGVPCQPWSQGGLHLGPKDERNLFPEVVKIIRRLRPKAVLIENVKGLTRKTFAEYFEYIQHQLRYPEVVRKSRESWISHLARLRREYGSGSQEGLCYTVSKPHLVNAANFGVPQRRERVFIIAFRSDLGIPWSFPEATHSLDALLWAQWVTGAYWDRHKVSKRVRPELAPRFRGRVSALKSDLFAPTESPWRTVRDAIADLSSPTTGRLVGGFKNHEHNPGARSYPGHTGSPWDEPSKTLKAGVHGVPGGENTVADEDGGVRYFTVREAARIQTFPDEYVFRASWTESMRQIGNAVPVELAEVVARGIAAHLNKVQLGKTRTVQPARQTATG